MKVRALPPVAVFVLLLSTAFAAPVPARAASPVTTPDAPATPFIVVLREGQDARKAVGRFSRSLAVRTKHTFRYAFPGFAARLTGFQRSVLARDPAVAYLVPDRPVYFDGQVTPNGVERVGALKSDVARIDGVDERVNADVAILDSGIDRSHPDLNVVGGYNCTTANRSDWGDRHGHGTHVAGIAGALDNGLGVVGMAPGARLWAVKVIGDDGYGSLSMILCGVEWMAAQRDRTDATKPLFEVGNMSLRTSGWDDRNCGYTNNDPLHRAICRAVAGGTTVVVAAGNQRLPASSGLPAAYDEVITVSALADFNGEAGGGAPSTCYSWSSYDVDDTYADFSNYGWDVDIIAPGKCILSTYPGSRYKLMSGTSMATPTVAGAVALWKSLHPESTPAHVKAVLQGAGRFNWFWWTDRDQMHERLLDVSSFGTGPGFSLALTSNGRQYVGPKGGTLRYSVEATRADGFDGTIALRAEDLPEGASAQFGMNPLAGLRAISSPLSVTVPGGLPEGPYSFRVAGTAGGLQPTSNGSSTTDSTTAPLTVDATPPSVQPPRVQLTGPAVGSYYMPVRVSWSASDSASGISRFALQLSTDGGAFTTLATLGGTTRESVRWLLPSHTYRFRIMAVDAVDNASAWSDGAAFQLLRYEQNSWRVAYGPGWRTSWLATASGGSVKYAKAAGAVARFSFNGKEVAWISRMGPTKGWARVYLDGVLVRSVNLYSPYLRPRTINFYWRWATTANRTLTIKVAGTAYRPRVDVDAFTVIR